MLQKLIYFITILIFLLMPHKVFGIEIQKTSPIFFSFGALYLTNEGFDDLKGSGRTVDNNDDATYLTIGYRLRPSFDIEFGLMNLNEISSSLNNGSSGILHGKSFSVCTECSNQSGGNNESPLELKGEFKTSYLFGVRYSPSLSNNIKANIKTGMLFWDTSFSASGSKFTYDGIDKSGRFLEVNGIDPYFALGASYKRNNKSAITFNYLFSEVFDNKISGPSLSWIQNF